MPDGLMADNGYEVQNNDNSISITLYSSKIFKKLTGNGDVDYAEVADTVEIDTIAE